MHLNDNNMIIIPTQRVYTPRTFHFSWFRNGCNLFFTQSSAQGTVPYLGIFLTDLTMLDTAVKDRLDVSQSHFYLDDLNPMYTKTETSHHKDFLFILIIKGSKFNASISNFWPLSNECQATRLYSLERSNSSRLLDFKCLVACILFANMQTVLLHAV